VAAMDLPGSVGLFEIGKHILISGETTFDWMWQKSHIMWSYFSWHINRKTIQYTQLVRKVSKFILPKTQIEVDKKTK
jgi:hypothetical protein